MSKSAAAAWVIALCSTPAFLQAFVDALAGDAKSVKVCDSKGRR